MMHRTLGVLVVLALVACTQPQPAASPDADFITVTTQPANVGDAKIAALAYHDSGAYDRDLAIVADQAKAWIASRAPTAKQPALVLDVDETALSNWEVLKRDDFGRPVPGPCEPNADTPCGWAAWDLLGRDPAIAPTLAVFQQARALNVTVFFITGRPESQRAATERNLQATGFGGYARLNLVPPGAHFASAADFKAPIRAEIEQAASQSSPIWATSLPICWVGMQRRSSCCPIHSTGYPDVSRTRRGQSGPWISH